jgi:hypothetical protein
MKKPKFSVDFNEMLEHDLVLLSKTDSRLDSKGEAITLFEGLAVIVYEPDVDKNGRPDNLMAEGVVEENKSPVAWAIDCKWCCRINGGKIHHESCK